MIKKISMALAALLVTAAAAAQTTGTIVTCESINNIRHTCWGSVGNGVVLNRVLSSNNCIRGQSWDVRSDNRGIWVDKGCRAEFLVGSNLMTASPVYGSFGQVITCESQNGRRQNCAANTAYGVAMSRRISSHKCDIGRDWGYNQGGIWVANGCRAEFVLGAAPPVGSMASSSRPALICESINNRINHCNADTSYGVSLLRQLSTNACVRNDSWGFDSKGVWVKKGCRAEFVLSANP